MMPPIVGLWPEHERIVDAFIAAGTQWRMGMGGPIGLDYGPLEFILTTLDIPAAEWPEVVQGVRVMEQAALEEMHKD